MAFQVTDDALSKLNALDDTGKRAVLEKLSGQERAQVIAALPSWRAKRGPSQTAQIAGAQAKILEDEGLVGRAVLGVGSGMQTVGRNVADIASRVTGIDALRPDAQRWAEDDEVARPLLATPEGTIGKVVGEVAATAPLGMGVGAGARAVAARVLPRALARAVPVLGLGAEGAAQGAVLAGPEHRAAGGLLGGALGLGLGGLSGGASAVLSGVRGRATRGLQEAMKAERAVQERLAQKAQDSALGTYRNEIQASARDLEVLERTAQGNGEVAEKAHAYLRTPKADELRARVALGKLESAPERIAAMEAAKERFTELAAGKEGNVAAQTAEALANPIKKHILPRALTLGARMLPLAGPAVGAVVGGGEGALLGTVAGGVMSLTQGLPGRILRNLSEKPAVRKAFWERVLSAAGGATPEKLSIVNALERAAQNGPAALVSTLRPLASSPEAAELLQAVASLDEPESAKAPPDRARALRKALE